MACVRRDPAARAGWWRRQCLFLCGSGTKRALACRCRAVVSARIGGPSRVCDLLRPRGGMRRARPDRRAALRGVPARRRRRGGRVSGTKTERRRAARAHRPPLRYALAAWGCRCPDPPRAALRDVFARCRRGCGRVSGTKTERRRAARAHRPPPRRALPAWDRRRPDPRRAGFSAPGGRVWTCRALPGDPRSADALACRAARLSWRSGLSGPVRVRQACPCG